MWAPGSPTGTSSTTSAVNGGSAREGSDGMLGTTRRPWGVVVAGLALAACATSMAAKPSTLYQRLGGREGIRGVVDDFVAFAVADDRIKGRFAGLTPAAVEKLKTNV